MTVDLFFEKFCAFETHEGLQRALQSSSSQKSDNWIFSKIRSLLNSQYTKTTDLTFENLFCQKLDMPCLHRHALTLMLCFASSECVRACESV